MTPESGVTPSLLYIVPLMTIETPSSPPGVNVTTGERFFGTLHAPQIAYPAPVYALWKRGPSLAWPAQLKSAVQFTRSQMAAATALFVCMFASTLVLTPSPVPVWHRLVCYGFGEGIDDEQCQVVVVKH